MMRLRLLERSLVPVAGAIAAATVLAGLAITAGGTDLGTPEPPFVSFWSPRAHWPAMVAVLGCVAAVALVPWVMRLPPRRFAAATLVITLGLRLAINASRTGPEAWAYVFGSAREAGNEYLPALPAFKYGTRYFLDHFAELVPALPVHAAGHPPGLLLTMHFAGLTTPARLAAFCIVAGALAAPLTYVLARELQPEKTARLAALLMTLAPGALLFGATSADAVYLTLGLLAAIGLTKKPLVGAVLLAVASLFAWSLLAVGAWAVLLIALRQGIRPAIRLGLIIAVVLLAGHAAFAAATGFDPLGALHATGRVYALGIASRRPYAYWLFGSPVAFLLVLGVPIAALAIRQMAARDQQAAAIAAVIAVSAIAGFTKAETERIWLFFAPFVCLAAAPRVRRPRLVAALLVTQALAYELLFVTVW